jgi:hypothetical protein
MKKIIYKICIVASMVSLIIACAKDDSTDNSSTPTDPRTKFTGSWLCKETSHINGTSTYPVTISLNSGNSTQIFMSNFYQLGSSIQTYGVVANNNITIPSQAVGSNFHVSGTGIMPSSGTTTINWNYYVNNGADIDTCTAVYTKQ